ncbi:unnamed protein product, partial [Ectocarpus sp. 12 AP-2014]
VPPSERGISLAQAGGGAVAIRDNRREEVVLPNGEKKQSPKRDEYAERVLSLTSILSNVAKFHAVSSRGRRWSRKGSPFVSVLGPEKVPAPPLGSNVAPSSAGNMTPSTSSNTLGFSASPPNSFMAPPPSAGGGGGGVGGGGGGVMMGSPPNGFVTSSTLASPPTSFMTSSTGMWGSPPPHGGYMGGGGAMASPTGGLRSALRKRFSGTGKGERSDSWNDGMPGAPLDAVVEEPELDDDAFERLAQHIGVHPIVVEAVWRDEWRRQAEAERALRAREAFQRDPADRQRSFSFTLKEDAQSIPPPAMGTPSTRGDVVAAASGSGGGDRETLGGGGGVVKG